MPMRFTKGNNMMSRTSKTPAPITHLRSETEASRLITRGSDIPRDARPIVEIEIQSQEQPHVSLGNFNVTHPPGGFAIHITPEPDPEVIVTQITSLGTEKEYELVLHIANYGNRTVGVEVWQL